MKMRWGLLGVAAVLTAGAAGYGVWQSNQPAPLSSDFASGNGRIEAVDIDIAAKTAGRVREILVDEGDMVQAGQTVARMDTDSLASELRQAEAQVKRSENARAAVERLQVEIADATLMGLWALPTAESGLLIGAILTREPQG
jgi:HlyD family secretion protein